MGLFDLFRKRGGRAQRAEVGRETQASKPPQEESGSEPDEVPLESLYSQRQRAGPARPLIYVFEHHTLRREVFENHPELVADLAGASRPRRFWHAIANAEILCQDNGFVGHSPVDESNPFARPYDAERASLKDVSIHPHRRGGYTVHVLAMPEPRFPPEAYFIAIVHRDDEAHEYMRPSPSTRYFTLEKTRGSHPPLFCEWDAGGTHRNFGTYLAPDMSSFVDFVFTNILQ